MKLLFICTGNTCRSPMAMAIANNLGHEAKSAGVNVGLEGMPASDGALKTMKKWGLSLEDHQTKKHAEKDILWADKVICLTPAHRDALIAYYPDYALKITSFASPVPDPFGGSDADYELTAVLIEKQLKQMW